MRIIKTVIIDDQTLFAESLKNVIESRSEDIKIIKVLYNGYSGLEYLERATPDLLLLDIRLPDINGVEIVKKIKKKKPEIKILMLTTFDDEEYIQKSLSLGVNGYLLKDLEPERLISAIHDVMTGNILVSPNVIEKLVKRVNRIENFQISMNVVFTKREKEIIELVIDGLTNKEISNTLFLAEQSVKNALSIIYNKCDVKNRNALVHKINSFLYETFS